MQNQSSIRPGMIVQDMSGDTVGAVEQVLASPDGQSCWLVLDGGRMNIPGEVVGAVTEDEVRISQMSADTIRSTAWGGVPADYAATENFAFQHGATATDDDSTDTEHIVVQRYEEDLAVDKHVTEVGQVSVSKRVVEEPQTVLVDVNRQEWDVERVDVERAWQQGDDAPRTEGDTIIVPIIAEKLEVMRRRVVIGEVRLTKRVSTEQREITETVRREVVEVSGPGISELSTNAADMETQGGVTPTS